LNKLLGPIHEKCLKPSAFGTLCKACERKVRAEKEAEMERIEVEEHGE
jgi:hypothetical protein